MRNGTDAPLAARRPGRRRVDRARRRATVRFVLKRPSDLALRALCDMPILPDHLVHDVRRSRRDRAHARSAPARSSSPAGIAASASASSARPKAGASRRRRRDRLRPRARRRARAQPHAARRARRPAARARRALPRAGRAGDAARRDQAAPPAPAPLLVPGRQPPPLPARRPALPPRAGGAVGSHALRPRAAQGPGHPDRRPAAGRGHPGAAVRSQAARGGAGRRRLPRQRRRRRARPPGPSDSPVAAGAVGQPLFHVEAHAFALELRKAGILLDIVPADAADHPAAPASGATSIWRRWSGRGARRGPAAALRRGRRLQLRRLSIDGAGRARSTRRAWRPGRRPGRRSWPHRAPAGRRPAGDLPLPLRRPGAGVGAGSRPGRGRRPPGSAAGLAGPLICDDDGAGGRAGGVVAASAPPPVCLPSPPRAGSGIGRSVSPARARGDRAERRRQDVYRQGKWDEARAKYRAAEEADADFLAPRLNVACSFVRQERFDEATAEVRALLDRAYMPWSREVLEAADLGALKVQPQMAAVRAALASAAAAWGAGLDDAVSSWAAARAAANPAGRRRRVHPEPAPGGLRYCPRRAAFASSPPRTDTCWRWRARPTAGASSTSPRRSWFAATRRPLDGVALSELTLATMTAGRADRNSRARVADRGPRRRRTASSCRSPAPARTAGSPQGGNGALVPAGPVARHRARSC